MWRAIILGAILTACGGGGNGGSYNSSSETVQTVSARMELAPYRWKGAPDSVEAWVAEYGGRLLSREKEEDRAYSYTLRIPTPKTEAFLAKVRRLGIVLSERTNLVDITKEAMDIESRLKIKEEAVERLQNLLRQARTPSEILEAEKALQTALSERDELRSQYENRRLLAEYIRLDLVLRNLRYVEYSQGGSYWLQLWRSVESGWDGFVYFTFALAYLWWLWLLIAILIFVLWRRQRRFNKAA
ncbi:MAG: DUF4349 domain-containing protein [Bacteroidia bacterium]|nr:DUF4349 domain-containing protein [Bacteroidia bacterium]